MTISEVSHRSGVAASAMRFYEEKGLTRSERAGSGDRRYQRAVLRRIAFIIFAQRLGMTLDEVGAELAKLPWAVFRKVEIGPSSRADGASVSTSALPNFSDCGLG